MAIAENKTPTLKISTRPVILVGCPFISESIKKSLEEKMALFLTRNMIAIVDFEKVPQYNDDIFYLSSTCQGCGTCDVGSAMGIIESLDVNSLCTQIILLANQKHPVIPKY